MEARPRMEDEKGGTGASVPNANTKGSRNALVQQDNSNSNIKINSPQQELDDDVEMWDELYLQNPNNDNE